MSIISLSYITNVLTVGSTSYLGDFRTKPDGTEGLFLFYLGGLKKVTSASFTIVGRKNPIGKTINANMVFGFYDQDKNIIGSVPANVKEDPLSIENDFDSEMQLAKYTDFASMNNNQVPIMNMDNVSYIRILYVTAAWDTPSVVNDELSIDLVLEIE